MLQVQNRVDSWVKKCPSSPSAPLLAQFKWESHVVEYVTHIHGLTKVHGNATKGTSPKPLSREIPLLGPQFIPPSYLHVQRCCHHYGFTSSLSSNEKRE
ncbi:hypothetical protein BC827DRAFT_1134220 [Russula dissimulans]|nr:hypothetical protein BC827DRAFT_1134220 [Russula dissimulans]